MKNQENDWGKDEWVKKKQTKIEKGRKVKAKNGKKRSVTGLRETKKQTKEIKKETNK